MEFKRENHWSAKLMPPKFVLAPLFHRTANLDPTKRDFNTERRDSHTECSSFTYHCRCAASRGPLISSRG